MAKRQTRVLSARCAFFAYLLLPGGMKSYAQSTFGTFGEPLAIRPASPFLKPWLRSTIWTRIHPIRAHRRQRRLPVRKPQARTLRSGRPPRNGIFRIFHRPRLELTARQSARVDLTLIA
jgi:hypothetical protein